MLKFDRTYDIAVSAYVTENGEWGRMENVLLFDDRLLTDAQWEIISILPDAQRIKYVIAILDGDDLTPFEQ
jgi:AAA+ superfamily predicted ATPase